VRCWREVQSPQVRVCIGLSHIKHSKINVIVYPTALVHSAAGTACRTRGVGDAKPTGALLYWFIAYPRAIVYSISNNHGT
jgi:hypothetical protein